LFDKFILNRFNFEIVKLRKKLPHFFMYNGTIVEKYTVHINIKKSNSMKKIIQSALLIAGTVFLLQVTNAQTTTPNSTGTSTTTPKKSKTKSTSGQHKAGSTSTNKTPGSGTNGTNGTPNNGPAADPTAPGLGSGGTGGAVPSGSGSTK
jgi:hypothetical protein